MRKTSNNLPKEQLYSIADVHVEKLTKAAQQFEKSMPQMERAVVRYVEAIDAFSRKRISKKKFQEIVNQKVSLPVNARRREDEKIVVNGITVNMKNQLVSHPQYGKHHFIRGRTPWKIIRLAAAEGGEVSLESLNIASSDIHKKLDLINKHYNSQIVFYKNGMVYLDPDFMS